MSDNIKLSTGKILRPNHGYIGLSEEMDCIAEGYDGAYQLIDQLEAWECPDDETDERYLTVPEQVELADIMIDRWLRFKATLTDHPNRELFAGCLGESLVGQGLEPAKWTLEAQPEGHDGRCNNCGASGMAGCSHASCGGSQRMSTQKLVSRRLIKCVFCEQGIKKTESRDSVVPERGFVAIGNPFLLQAHTTCLKNSRRWKRAAPRFH